MAWVKELLATLVLLDSPPCIAPMCNNAWAPQSSTFQNRKIPKCHQKMPKKNPSPKLPNCIISDHYHPLPSCSSSFQFLPVPSDRASACASLAYLQTTLLRRRRGSWCSSKASGVALGPRVASCHWATSRKVQSWEFQLSAGVIGGIWWDPEQFNDASAGTVGLGLRDPVSNPGVES